MGRQVDTRIDEGGRVAGWMNGWTKTLTSGQRFVPWDFRAYKDTHCMELCLQSLGLVASQY